jgi:hypothetical protein
VEQLNPRVLKAYDAWTEEARDTERPVFITLGVLLVLLTDLGVIVSGLVALVVVVTVTTLGRLRWIHDHADDILSHTE